MKQELHLLLGKIGAFALSAAFMAALVGLVFIDVHWLHNFVHETSLTEAAQELLLLAISGGFFAAARRQAERRSAWLLVGGFFLCMLIREMDFAFDALWHGAWVWFALAVALACLWHAARHIAATVRGLAYFVTHPGYGMMCAGLLCILVFSTPVRHERAVANADAGRLQPSGEKHGGRGVRTVGLRPVSVGYPQLSERRFGIE